MRHLLAAGIRGGCRRRPCAPGRVLPMVFALGVVCLGLLFSALPGSAFGGGTGGGAAVAGNLERVVFVPQWSPQAQFAGFYVAYEKGFYRENGLDVSILRGGPDRPSPEWLRKGAADFCTMFLAEAISERSRGTRLVNIAQVIPKSMQVLVARKSSGIRNWHDMSGKRIGLWSGERSASPLAHFRKYGIKPVIVPQAFTVNLFLSGGLDVVSAMSYNEYQALLLAGLDPGDLIVFDLGAYGLSFPEDGIYCLESTLAKDPERVCRFVRASMAGWSYAFRHMEEALDIVMKYVTEARVPSNRVHQKWMIEKIRDVVSRPDATRHWFPVNENEYDNVAVELKMNGLIDRIPPFSEFCVDCSVAYAK